MRRSMPTPAPLIVASLILFVVGTVSTTHAGKYSDEFQSSGYALGAAEYLKLPVHAQAASLGSAVGAWREGLAGSRLNPAVLDHADSLGLTVSTSFLTFDRKLLSTDLAGPFGDYVVLGASFTSLTVDDFDGRDPLGNPTGAFNSREQAVTLSAAGRIIENVAVGVSARYLGQQLASERASGMGFDLGVTWTPIPQVCAALSGTSLLSRLWWTTGHVDRVQPAAVGAVNGTFLDSTISAELDIAKTLRQPLDIAFGLQYSLLNLIFLRAGTASSIDYRDRQYREPDLSCGLGVRYSFFGADYALVAKGSVTDADLGFSHFFSARMEIPNPVE